MKRTEPVVDQRWVFRPSADRPDNVQALAGLPVHGVGVRVADGFLSIVLSDGTRLRVRDAEVALRADRHERGHGTSRSVSAAGDQDGSRRLEVADGS